MTLKMFINDNGHKFNLAIRNLKADAPFTYNIDTPLTEELYNTVEWITGVDESNDTAITTKVNPYPELTWSAVDAEMQRLQADYDAQDYARKRQTEYPQIKDFMEAYTEKEIGGNTGKTDAYEINYNKVRTENPK